MKNKRLQEILLVIAIIALVLLVVNPWHIFMPIVLWWGCLVAAVVVFGVFAAFFWRESVHDEREAYHRLIAGRIGFLAGASVLLIAIIVQAVMKQPVDSWLPISLGTMLVAKIIAAAYSEERL